MDPTNTKLDNKNQATATRSFSRCHDTGLGPKLGSLLLTRSNKGTPATGRKETPGDVFWSPFKPTPKTPYQTPRKSKKTKHTHTHTHTHTHRGHFFGLRAGPEVLQGAEPQHHHLSHVLRQEMRASRRRSRRDVGCGGCACTPFGGRCSK